LKNCFLGLEFKQGREGGREERRKEGRKEDNMNRQAFEKLLSGLGCGSSDRVPA
jgi:hypothetical protein